MLLLGCTAGTCGARDCTATWDGAVPRDVAATHAMCAGAAKLRYGPRGIFDGPVWQAGATGAGIRRYNSTWHARVMLGTRCAVGWRLRNVVGSAWWRGLHAARGTAGRSGSCVAAAQATWAEFHTNRKPVGWPRNSKGQCSSPQVSCGEVTSLPQQAEQSPIPTSMRMSWRLTVHTWSSCKSLLSCTAVSTSSATSL